MIFAHLSAPSVRPARVRFPVWEMLPNRHRVGKWALNASGAFRKVQELRFAAFWGGREVEIDQRRHLESVRGEEGSDDFTDRG